MRAKKGSDRAGPPLEILDQIDRICDQFEAAWEAGERPRIEDYVGRIGEADRAALLSALLAADLEARRRRGEQPEPGQYNERFPGDWATIDSAFGERPCRGGAGPATAVLASETCRDLTSGLAGAGDQDSDAGNDHAANWVGDVPVRHFRDYEISHELGRGGMGVVYEARQLSLNRPVALKMIRAGALADQIELRRFQNEVEAVAALDHTGIVPVYEVGEQEGQRFFSMKLVRGGPLSGKLEQYGDDPRGAARLVALAAEAVHHAHLRGILHRDLKPANILVDENGQPHITDFGLARRVEGESELTQSGAILGTPAYMAPEQASGHGRSVTTVTDVYGLAAVLYALLTGKAPFGCDSVIETLDAVRTMPPEPPSRKNAKVPRDLEIICLKALQKEPSRRYASARDLALDLRRWLRGEPIAARPVGGLTRAWMWCKRRPAIAALAAAVFLAIVGGTTTVIAVQAKANASLRAANKREKQRFDLAMKAIQTFHTGVSEDLLLKQPEFRDLRDTLLRQPVEFYRELGVQLEGQTDRPSRRALAQAYHQLGGLTAKVGSKEEALADHRKGLAVRESLVREDASDDEARFEVGLSQTTTGWLLKENDRSDEAQEMLERAKSTFGTLTTAHPENAKYLEELAYCDMLIGLFFNDIGRLADSLEHFARARSVYESMDRAGMPRTDKLQAIRASLHNNAAKSLARLGRLSEAIAGSRRAREIWEELARSRPGVLFYQYELAINVLNIAYMERELAHMSEAAVAFKEAQQLLSALTKANPAVTSFRSQLGLCEAFLGAVLNETGRSAESLDQYGRARVIFESLVQGNPDFSEYQLRLAWVHNCTGNSLREMGKADDAKRSYDRAREIQELMVQAHPSDPGRQNDLARTIWNMGSMLLDSGKPDQAIESLKQAIGIQDRLVENYPEVVQYRTNLAYQLAALGQARHKAGQPSSEAQADFRRAVAILSELTTPTAVQLFDLASIRAQFGAFAAGPGSGMSDTAARSELDRAFDALRGACAAGFRNLAVLRTSSYLDPLRSRPDFQLLMLDLAFPADAFAH
jgi:tetratricopeptide (TPR) repeat protein